jgi:hypothetical protein
MRWLAAVFASIVLLQSADAGAQTRVDLELVLAVDASRSIDSYEYRLQREGYARALRDPAIVRAITSGEYRRIALVYVEWSSSEEQAVLVDWAVVDGQAAAEKFAAALLAAPRRFYDATSVSGGIDFSVKLFGAKGIRGTRRVIDVSGDGPNNRGRPSSEARDDAVKAGITINGLAILNDRPSRPPWQEEEVDVHYRREVVGGPGAFVIVVKGFREFSDAIRQKLLREISGVRGPRRQDAANASR